MNTEEIATDRHYPVRAFPMDSGYISTSDPIWNWKPSNPYPIDVSAYGEAHTERFFGIVSESSDIGTDNLNYLTDRKNMLAVAPKEPTKKIRLAKMAYIVLADSLRSNAWFHVSATSEMFEWNNRSFDSPRTPLVVHDLTGLTGIQVQLLPKPTEKKRELWQVWQAYRDRIKYLRSEVELDGFRVNEASEKDFWSFFRSMPFLRKAGVILMDNGNLRAVWRGEDKIHVGLQFLGDQSVEYVIFKRRQGAKEVSRAAGFDTLDGFKKQIQAFDLKTLVYT